MLTDKYSPPMRGWGRWYLRLAVAVIMAFGVTVIFVSNRYLTERFTETIGDRAEVRLALYSANLMAELQRNAVLPQVLVRDPELINALEQKDYSGSTDRLLSFVNEIGAASLRLLDASGVAVAATQADDIGVDHSDAPYFSRALAGNDTVFTAVEDAQGGFDFVYARRVLVAGVTRGIVIVEIDAQRIEAGWSGTSSAVLVTDRTGRIVMSTIPVLHGLQEQQALDRQLEPNSFSRLIRFVRGLSSIPVDAYVGGEAVLRREIAIPHEGWSMVSFTTYASVRERVFGILALQAMAFMMLLVLVFWLASRKTASRLIFFQRESAELRALNRRLQREIAEREKVEKTLQVAEQTIAQSSKLAALGEMSAAISHELNQPLAAMKTYLAGARLLLQRERNDEALASFHRIDDLLERMGALTKQLKSYARKGDVAFEAIDTRAAISTALALMEPQLKSRSVNIIRTLPDEPVMIHGDRLRLEQVIINLLRNALDATKNATNPTIEILLAAGDIVSIQIRDNGEGIDNLEELFEPFYTTKQPGDGVGLGLAISSGIVSDLGGRLIARNAFDGGAIFEVQLPVRKQGLAAAE